MNECVDCGARIGVRATRCKDCRRKHRTRYERERVESKRAAKEREDFSPEASPMGQEMLLVDYSQGGHKPPSPHDVPKKPAAGPVTGIVDYTSGGHPAPSTGRRLDYTGIPASDRQDFVRAAMIAARNAARDEENQMSSWDELAARSVTPEPAVFFRSAQQQGPPAISNPAANGTLYQRAQPRPKTGPQRVPHIV